MKKSKGFTLIEIVVVLAIIATIAAFITPMLFDYLKEAKVTRAKADVRNIAAAIANFNRDLQVWPVYKAGTDYDNAKVLVLRTDEGNLATTDKTEWNAVEGDTIQTLDSALQEGKMSDKNTLYSAKVKKPGEWKGPYMTDFKADPWGNKYYVSTQGLLPGKPHAAFVLSAGPNGYIDTALSQDIAGGVTAFEVGSDDIVYRIK